MTVAEVPTDKFAWLTRSHNSSSGEEVFTLRSCSAIPMERAKDDTSCVVVFETGEGIIDIPAGFRKRDVSTSGEFSGKYCCSDLDLIFQDIPSENSGHVVEDIAAIIEPVFDEGTDSITGLTVTQEGLDGGQPTFLDEQCTRVVVYADQV